MPISKCFTDLSYLQIGIDNCWRDSRAHGDSRTSDYYCGKDPNLTFQHDALDQVASI